MRYINKAVAIVLLVCMTLMLVPVTAEAAETNVKLSGMHTASSNYYEVFSNGESITDSYGNTYKSNIAKFVTSELGYATFDLNGAYTRFSGTIVASNQTGSGAEMNIAIFADGKEVYSLTGYTRQKAGEKFDVDVTGVRTLEIKTSYDGDNYRAWLYLVESSFVKSDTTAIYPNWASLNEQVVIDSDELDQYVTLMRDSFGGFHNGCQRLYTGSKGYVLYNLNKQYITFTGAVVAGINTGSGASMTVKIYCDDKLVFTAADITRQTPMQPFSIDVRNVQVLKVETSNVGDSYRSWAYIVDDVLSMHTHTPGEWKIEKEATCTQKGTRAMYCTECGEQVKTETIDAAGHTVDEQWVVAAEATCTQKGREVQNCTVCGEQANERAIDMLQHKSSGNWIVKREANCHIVGQRVQTCDSCGKELEKEDIPMTEHTYGNWTAISGSIWNCPIVKERVCSICGDTETKEDNSMSWLKPLVTVLVVIVIGGVAVLGVTLHMNGLPLHPSSIQQLFKKETLTDEDIDEILNKQDSDSEEQ